MFKDISIVNLLSDLGDAFLETGLMMGISLSLALIVGIPLGLVIFLTRKDIFWHNKIVNFIGGTLINIVRSLPFVILLILLLPLARILTGKTTGPLAATVSLSIASIAFFARLVEGALSEVDKGVIEAAASLGASPFTIIFHVLISEALPGLIRGFTVTAISLVGFSAMAGVVGGGGIGFLAINYGYYRYQTDVMIVTVVVLILIVQLLQITGDSFAKKADKR